MVLFVYVLRIRALLLEVYSKTPDICKLPTTACLKARCLLRSAHAVLRPNFMLTSIGFCCSCRGPWILYVVEKKRWSHKVRGPGYLQDCRGWRTPTSCKRSVRVREVDKSHSDENDVHCDAHHDEQNRPWLAASGSQRSQEAYDVGCCVDLIWRSMGFPPNASSQWIIELRESYTMCESLYYTILYYTILYYTILYYTILYYTILYYTILYYTVLYCTILYYTILYYTILCYAMLCYAMLCHAMPCHAMLCYAMLCYAVPCCAMLCYAILDYTTLD